MAYLTFDEASFATAARHNQSTPPRETGLFSPLEWLVIALARRDRLSSLREPGRFARAAAALFRGPAERPLAAPRLEALRRLAVLARHHGGDVPAAEMAAFHRAGFSADQAATLLASVAVRGARRRA